MAIEKEITLTFSDRLKLHETTNELKNLIKEYNFKLIDKGLAVKRSQLRKNDTINVQDICNYIYDDEWSLPEIPFNKFEIEKTICEMPNLWHYLIPCFKTGILQLNKARYIYFDVIDTNTENKSITVELIDYSHDNAIWQRGISETVTFKLKDFNQDTFQKKMSSYSTQLLLKQKSNTSRNEVFTKICIAILSNFIRDVITETNQMTYADIYKLLSIDDLKWTKYQYDMWEKIIIKYSQKFLDLTERQRSFDSLLLQYTAFIIASNIAIEQTKAYPDKIQEQYVKSKTTEPDKIITTIQNIKFTSKERCNFEPTNAKEAAKYSCTPIKGMLTINDDLETEQGDNPTHDGFYTTPRYFVPFKKNAKGCDLEDLAWSKAVNLRSRRYADTEDECIEIYNDLIMRNARHLIILAKEYTSNITGNVTDADKTFIEKLNNM